MSTSFQGRAHAGAESHHYYRQDTAPTASDPLQVGDLWSDTASNVLKRCTSVSPVTFVSVEGGSSAHDLFSSTHGDVDDADTPSDGDILQYDGNAGKWKAEDPDAHGDHHDEDHAARHAESGDDELLVEGLGSTGDAGQLFKADGSGGVDLADDEAGINFIIDGGGEEITTGIKGDVELPFDGEITAARLFADQTGSIVVDIWKEAYASFPPTDSESITDSTPPTISSGVKSEDTTLSGWTTSFSKGDILRFNVDSVTGIERVTLSLSIRRL